MKQIYLLIILLFLFSSSFSQVQITGGDMSDNKSPILEIIDTATVIVHYRQKVIHDTIKNSNITDHYFLLQIGNKISKYADYFRMKSDSVLLAIDKTNDNNERMSIVNESFRYSHNTTGTCIYKSYPNNKTVTVTNNIGSNYYKYEEPTIILKWQLENETKSILGYVCKKAKTKFSGRNYIAWYTIDIPINNGPWKFSGLPGLILEVVDDRGQVSFNCVAIEKSDQRTPIFIKKKDYIKLKKKTYYDLVQKLNNNPAAYFESSGVSFTLDPKSSKDTNQKLNRKRNYNPLEIEY